MFFINKTNCTDNNYRQTKLNNETEYVHKWIDHGFISSWFIGIWL
jgi:hypothetical protein